MIFVTMDDDNLIARTNYSIRYEDYSDGDGENSDDEVEHRQGTRPPQADPCDTGQEDRESQPLIESSIIPGVLYRGRTANNLRNTDAGPSRIEATPDAASSATQIPLLEPHATFFNRDRKNKCVINFEPAMYGFPCSSRFLPEKDYVLTKIVLDDSFSQSSSPRTWMTT